MGECYLPLAYLLEREIVLFFRKKKRHPLLSLSFWLLVALTAPRCRITLKSQIPFHFAEHEIISMTDAIETSTYQHRPLMSY
jgi:hypothetical protein